MAYSKSKQKCVYPYVYQELEHDDFIGSDRHRTGQTRPR